MTAPLQRADIEAWLDRSPFVSFLGLSVLDADPAAPALTMRMPLRPEFLRTAGAADRWHGGVIAALIDTVGDFALIMLHGAAPPTVNMRIDYLRPIVGAFVTATATVRKTGRSIGFVDVDVRAPDGELVAIGRANYATSGLPQPAAQEPL